MVSISCSESSSFPSREERVYFQTFFRHPSFLNFLIVCFKTDNRLKPFPNLVYSLISYQLPSCSTSFSCKKEKLKVPEGSTYQKLGPRTVGFSSPGKFIVGVFSLPKKNLGFPFHWQCTTYLPGPACCIELTIYWSVLYFFIDVIHDLASAVPSRR